MSYRPGNFGGGLRSGVGFVTVARSAAAEGSEEGANLAGEQVGFFQREEVSADGGVSPVLNVGVAAVGQLPRVADVFDGEGHPGGHGDQRPWWVVGVVVVGAERRADGAGGPVQGDDGEQLVAAEPALEVAVAVAPGPVLVDDPGGQPRRGVGERGCQGVGPGGLDGAVAAVGLVLDLAAVKVGLFGGRQGLVW